MGNSEGFCLVEPLDKNVSCGYYALGGAEMKVTRYNSREQLVDIDVNEYGTFSATVDGVKLEAKSLEDLKPKIDRATKQEQARVAIPFVRYVKDSWRKDGGKFKRGFITGLHASNSNLLVKFEGEKGSTQEYIGEYLKLTPEQEVEYQQLVLAAEAAAKLQDAFEKKHSFDGKEAVQKALAKVGGGE